MRERDCNGNYGECFLQYKDFQTEPSEEETEYAKWEGYKALVLKMRRQVATIDDFDGAKVGDNVEFDAEEVGDGDSDAKEVGDDAEDSGGRSLDFNEQFD